jgi:hypothetical protein
VPSDLVAFSAIACEKILLEGDGVPSVIRLLDVVFVDPAVPPEKRPAFIVELLVQGRFKAGVRRKCTVHVDLIRTDGERIRIHSQEMGTAFIEVSLEDTSVRIPITFLAAPQPVSE